MFVIPILERVDSLDLRLRTLTIRTSKGMSTNGVNVDVVSCCQVKVQGWSPGQDGEMIIDMAAVRLAAQHFIGKKREQMNDAIQKTIAGHQRGIIATLTVEELYRDRAAFSSRVVEVCEQDMRNMGLAIVSYTVAEISDENDYVKALGVSQTEKVKREATEGAARHINFALSLESELQTEADVKINKQRGRKVESDKMLLVRKADADRVVEQALAIQRKAGQIKSVQHDGYLQVQKQDTRTKKNIAKRSTLALRVEKERMETTVNVTVHADAELYKKRVEADISRVFALANADRIKVEGEAEAEADRAKGKAEMDVLKERVNVWMDRYAYIHFIYGFTWGHVVLLLTGAIDLTDANDANDKMYSANPGAVMEKLIDTLPAIAAEIAAPLGNTERLVFIGGRGEERIPAQFETNRARSWRGGT